MDGFMLYSDIAEQIDLLSDDEAGKLLKGLMSYAFNGETMTLPLPAQIVFLGVKSKIDRDFDKYEATKKRRSDAGKKHTGNQYSKSTEQNGTNGTSVPFVPNVGTERNKMEQMEQTVTVTVPVTVTETVTEEKEKIKEKVESREKKSGFRPPSLAEIVAYIAEKGYKVDAERFFDFYESKGWMVGKSKMKDWKAAVRNWDRTDKKERSPTEINKNYGEVGDDFTW